MSFTEIARITERPAQEDLDRMLDLITELGEDSVLGEFLMDIWRRIYRGEPVVLYAVPPMPLGNGLTAHHMGPTQD